ncbi:MAG: YkgJ family cysteine cluster protein [Nanoarchaeota archaeon]|nr:YkgJ family cysteine cluster protein [Nanoarchaeota archaeon]MBU1704923.1 YkgJ family cysteine cluster protein [Nanoarchaeota archaeon]
MVLCHTCNGKCCKYITVIIDEPEDKEDWDEIKWWLLHKGVQVYLDSDDDWVVQISTRCKHLNNDNKCDNYENRPEVCREYTTEECEANEDEETKALFKKPEDVDKYLKEKNIRF